MCITLISIDYNREFPIIIISNRDEFRNRSYLQLNQIISKLDSDKQQNFANNTKTDINNKVINTQSSIIYAGIDIKSQGMWFGCNVNGKFGTITNYRVPNRSNKNNPDLQSRGTLVRDYLENNTYQNPHDYLLYLTSVISCSDMSDVHTTTNHISNSNIVSESNNNSSNHIPSVISKQISINDDTTTDSSLSISPHHHIQYDPFNLILGNVKSKSLSYYSSNRRQEVVLEDGQIYCVSNAYLETEWYKTERLKQLFQEKLNNFDTLFPIQKQVDIDNNNTLNDNIYNVNTTSTITLNTNINSTTSKNIERIPTIDNLQSQLLSILMDQKRPSHVSELPQTGLPVGQEYALSSIFIDTPHYGTILSTILIIDQSGIYNGLFY